MAFQINTISPPDGGNPVGGGYQYLLPPSSGADGQGNPCGAVGYPSVVLTFERMSDTVWDWYKDFTGDNPSVALTSLQVWNPYAATPGWVTYSTSAIMHRPNPRGGMSGGYYLDVEIKFTKLS